MKPISNWPKWILIISASLFIFALIGSFSNKKLETDSEKIERLENAKIKDAADELAAIAKRVENDKMNRVVAVRNAILDNANDPDSVIFDREFYSIDPDIDTVCVAYRAKNGFGGMVRGYAVGMGDSITFSKNVFEINCEII